ncbi:hypothetical protein NKH77_08995 [Streptomyces sp. M19]
MELRAQPAHDLTGLPAARSTSSCSTPWCSTSRTSTTCARCWPGRSPCWPTGRGLPRRHPQPAAAAPPADGRGAPPAGRGRRPARLGYAVEQSVLAEKELLLDPEFFAGLASGTNPADRVNPAGLTGPVGGVTSGSSAAATTTS